MTTPRPLTFALIAVLASTAPTFAQDSALNQLRAENETLKAENATLRQQLRALQEKLITSETGRQQLTTEKQQLVAQTQKIVDQNNAYFITTDFDTAANTTTLSSRSSDMDITRGAGRYHWISLEASFKGKTPPSSQNAQLNFQTFFTGGVYGKIKNITLTADHQTLTLPITEYENRYRRGGTARKRTRKDDEFFTATLTAAQITTLAHAKSVTGAMGYTQFNLTADQLNSIQTLARQLKLID